MGRTDKETFVCLDIESTGLDVENDRIIEVAAIVFTFTKTVDTYETLVDPQRSIPQESIEIHNISQEMVTGQPKIVDLLPTIYSFINRYPIVGHGILFDLKILDAEAARAGLPATLTNRTYIDTLRLARLYGESPTNSLEMLRKHFNIPAHGAHRAMNDVLVNIEVFKHLSTKFKTVEALLERLKKPIPMRAMPLGKHKGRSFGDIPVEYLRWAVRQDFDQDLLFSLKQELKTRKKGNTFRQAANPFSSLQ